ncbi:pyridoxamine 5'-phosphate oxidase family protein [Mycobacterium montefiorense]|uniref:pyridoxamine 5'-phosphate oxidase family protein n=1 Tax=Mycobacterium montefiorense TaxID=154654 RepID=UPI0021F26632|nr:pyridoxamine 5'-phosphate oxidase family protein [Mycobacterium montefiorense]MCV7428936.1 pyridoxamine 5'-phosphate oxidase family protein [Mycobacterium montefiorense]
MRTKKRVDLDRLAAALPDYPFAYLITVDDGYRVHTVTVEPRLRDLSDGPDGRRTVVDVGLIGGRTRENLAHRSDVTLLWPPPEPGGYSLIVDGEAETTESGSEAVRLGVLPTRALLHREADPDSPDTAKGCLHDCVVFSLPA